MVIRAVISDAGGVLLQMEEALGAQPWLDRLGLTPKQLAKLVFDSEISERAMLGEIPASRVWHAFGSRFGLTDAEVHHFREDFWTQDRLNRRWVDFLRTLRPKYRTAILSNSWDEAQSLLTDRYGLDEVVDAIILSAEEGVVKPDPAIYEIVVDRLGVRFDQAVFVDDREDNVEAARELGMTAFRFKDTDQALADVRSALELD